VTLRYMQMDQHHALYTIVRKYARMYPKKGLTEFAQQLGTTVNVIRNKVRPTIDTHHVTSEDESRIMEICQAAGIEDALAPLKAKNLRHGMYAFPIPHVGALTDETLMQTLCRAMKEFGELSAAAAAAIADGKVTLVELDGIKKEAEEALAAIGELEGRLRERAQQDVRAT
jgi:NAD-dependent DNA ligase